MFCLLFLHFLLPSTIIIFTISMGVLDAVDVSISNGRYCRPIPDQTLQKKLGESFDARYMSMADPRKTNLTPVAPQLASLDLTDDYSTINGRRHRRRNFKEPWTCDTTPEVIDLGPNYYPRYLNSKKCTSDRCFYGAYYCRPRKYSVSVLVRLQGACQEMPADKVDFLPYDVLDKDQPILVEAWELTRYDVVVYCECKVFPDRAPS